MNIIYTFPVQVANGVSNQFGIDVVIFQCSDYVYVGSIYTFLGRWQKGTPPENDQPIANNLMENTVICCGLRYSAFGRHNLLTFNLQIRSSTSVIRRLGTHSNHGPVCYVLIQFRVQMSLKYSEKQHLGLRLRKEMFVEWHGVHLILWRINLQ
jgi:hypothetical protein